MRLIRNRCMLLTVSWLLAVLGVTMPVFAAGGELTVGVPADRCPVFYQDPETGEVVGIGPELMRAACESAGYEVTFKTVEEENLKAALDNEGYDLVMPFGSAITSSQGRSSIVSENLIQTPFTLVTLSGKKVPSLEGLRIGMLYSLSGAAETVKELYPQMEILLYDTMADGVRALRSGAVDALLHNSYVWSYVLQKPSYADLQVQPYTMFSMDFRAGTLDTPEGEELLARLNEGILALPDTLRQAIILDYTSRRLYRYDPYDYLYRYGPLVVLALFLLLATLFVAARKIRRLHEEGEKKMREMMDYDSLTGLLNLNGFRKRMGELLLAHPDTHYFLSYNNIRDFKFINASLGRQAGDDLLRFWAKKSLENLSDEEVIARIETDHFAVLRRIEGEKQMRSDEKSVFAPVENYFINQGLEPRVVITSGIYVLTSKDFRTIDIDHMLDLARMTERKARDDRKCNLAFYNPEQWVKEKRVADISASLPDAMRNGEIQVWYQPQVDYTTGKITGAEALCRWNHGRLGRINPGEFISILEETGFIYDLDSFVWERVCQDLSRWEKEGHSMAVSVNVSRADLRNNQDIPGHFRDLIQKYDLSPGQLRIEITETAFTQDPALLLCTTEKLREMGFQVEMDDFGSGSSSLHMLKEVPVDRVKLDLHFLTASGDPVKCRIIIGCVIHMLHLLGISMIAEGVETLDQAVFLKNENCFDMQGFYFYKPMPVEEFEKIWEENK